jgi:nucleotide-binding universal stress UspA family protein
MRYERIVVATDHSDAGKVAVRSAARMAAAFGAEVTLLHVQAPLIVPEVSSEALLALQRQEQQTNEARLATLRKAELGGLPGKTKVLVHPSVAAAIVDEAAAADLCVVGTHGKKGVKRLVVGSVAERVVRHAPCDVMVARSSPVGPIVAGTDFSAGALTAVETARTLAGVLFSRLVVAHVLDVAPEVGRTRRDAQAAMNEFFDEYLAGARASAEVVEGDDAAEDLAAFASGRSASLLVVGTHGKTALARFFIGSVAEKVVRLAPCAVIVARERGGAAR